MKYEIEMIVKLKLFSLFIILIVCITVSYYSYKENFVDDPSSINASTLASVSLANGTVSGPFSGAYAFTFNGAGNDMIVRDIFPINKQITVSITISSSSNITFTIYDADGNTPKIALYTSPTLTSTLTQYTFSTVASYPNFFLTVRLASDANAVVPNGTKINWSTFSVVITPNTWDVFIPSDRPSQKWSEMKSMCEAKGQRLCNSNEMCTNGTPLSNLNTFGNNDNWFAVGDTPNQWQTYNPVVTGETGTPSSRLCKTYSQVVPGVMPPWSDKNDPIGFYRAAKCCPALSNGTTVSCMDSTNAGKLYRYENNKLRLYPTADIAQSWDPNFSHPISVPNCSTMTKGDPMERYNVSSPVIINPLTNSTPYRPQVDMRPIPLSNSANSTSTSTSSTSSTSATPRTPQVSLSDTGYTAMELKQRSSLIQDIQRAVKNELLADRATQHVCSSEHKNDSESHKSCDHDMSQYIKKDSIPCWGCSLDY